MNIYPSWKNWLVIIVVALGIFFALPNLFGEDPAIQFKSKTSEIQLDDPVVERINAVLASKNIEAREIVAENGELLIRLREVEDQLKAIDDIRAEFSTGQDKDKYGAALTFAPRTPKWMNAIGMGQIGLGLDLRGGVHFLYEVDLESFIKTEFEKYEASSRTRLRKANLRSQTIKASDNSVYYEFKDIATRDEARKVLSRDDTTRTFTNGTNPAKPSFTVTLDEAQLKARQDFAITQNITTLRTRVEELGVSEPQVQRQGLNRIVVQLPGVQDPARADEILGSTATLEFRLVDQDNDAYKAAETGRAPLGTKLFNTTEGQPILLKRQVIASGEHLSGASSGVDTESGTPAVFVDLSGTGAENMLQTTKANIGKPMAVVFISQDKQFYDENKNKLDKPIVTETQEVINVATINGVFSSRFQITGIDSIQRATDTALLLRAGALAAPLYKVEERTIGPSLGQDNIDSGMRAIIYGFIAIFLFMLLYYKKFGLYANIALIVNLVLIMALLSILPTSLTLPGIAGIVLTVGMAVDANVLIFERIREEIDVGSTPQASIHAGYAKAFSSIADANVTTFIAAIVLFALGTGPVKGFAVTLMLGIMTSMFTAIVGTRALVNFLYGTKPRIDNLSI
ncbi:MAG: protein translocase subunit SecD [Gammaproteobacteria bacterium]|nr:protein translocase subunit SecD [Gammaproteobacteria bacterium]NNM13802.1 protein translocase subunit SecD [Gammaproteobacteria bacterium]